jgi:4-hydroxythreonine-4-phosphate dehydrogenase
LKRLFLICFLASFQSIIFNFTKILKNTDMQSKREKINAAITQGDINGIGYEIIIKTLQDNRINDFVTPIVYGSPKLLAYHRKALNINSFNLTNITSPNKAHLKRGNIINCTDDSARIELGKVSKDSGKASYDALERATADLAANEVDVLVTAPINKESINMSAFDFPGHTEYLKEKFKAEDVLMIMVGERIRVGAVTGHIPIKKIPESINKELVLKKLRILNHSLKRDFGIQKAKIAVLGLNPHAGDGGLLGSEEKDEIIPAVNQARDEGILALGPYPADGFFGSSDYMQFDAVLAMYHDQGLIPFKAMEYEKGVNYTAGLPVVRTSPAHGTAYEIVGKNSASPASFRAALFLATKIFQNRESYDELNSNSIDNNNK